MSPTSIPLTCDDETRDDGREADPRFFHAVQYVLGELSESDERAFEAALPDDLALCALVAEAARLTRGVQLAATPAFPLAASTSAGERRDRWSVAIVAALAAGVAALLLASFAAPVPRSSTQAAQLVFLWRDAGRTNGGPAASDAVIDAETLVTAGDDRVPTWLLAAVSLEHRPGRQPLKVSEPSEPWEEN